MSNVDQKPETPLVDTSDPIDLKESGALRRILLIGLSATLIMLWALSIHILRSDVASNGDVVTNVGR